MTAISLPQMVQELSPACLPATCVTLRKPFNCLGCSAPVCRKGTWLDQISDILLQEQHHDMNVGNKVLLLPVSVKEVVEKWA